ncbi:hypothetical protein ACIQC9_12425 [Brevundimonas sp. NPDC092305]|uniref:hypothetical protein n=1 Tax=Brevundimonas sp. NPDC092305 TaxID=3363957 RepID=UPI00382C3F5C
MIHLILTALTVQHYPAALVTIDVGAIDQTPAHVITVSPAHARPVRSQADRDRIAWRAVRSWQGGSQSITSEDCPVLSVIAGSMDGLPPIPVSPPSLLVAPDPLPIPPTIKDGYSLSLSFRTMNSDGSTTDLTLKGGTVYYEWASNVVNQLASCWGRIE